MTPYLFPISHDAFLADVARLSARLDAGGWRPDYLVGIGRGGLVPAVHVSHRLNIPMLSVDYSSKVAGFAAELLGKIAAQSAAGARLLFIDDINDSGGTIADIRRLLGDRGCDAGNLRFAVLLNNIRSRESVDYRARDIDRDSDRRWFVFPWEAGAAREDILAEAASVPERLR
ncbi:phosphoribosyltransferase [Sphingobium amiense]|uniref:Phosphoribosyltransferase n=1 Tax=Sphingobium amiense TaxID=135719 RepID=A0A494WGW7_9SPHN|nr:phosphoribosyltransferase family protein [Sphingobium amiense]BBE00060.1 phosphoribosyltransferase [Sphingobium amiense]